MDLNMRLDLQAEATGNSAVGDVIGLGCGCPSTAYEADYV